jgi:hypothetical protein
VTVASAETPKLPATIAAPAALSKPRDDANYTTQLNTALQVLRTANEKALQDLDLGKYPRWDLNQQDGTLKFSDSNGKVQLTARVTVAGAHAAKANTFTWSWADSRFAALVTRDMGAVKAYGAKMKLKDLTESTIPANEQEAWAMTAVALRLTNGQAAYRAPMNDGSLFLILKSLKQER